MLKSIRLFFVTILALLAIAGTAMAQDGGGDKKKTDSGTRQKMFGINLGTGVVIPVDGFGKGADVAIPLNFGIQFAPVSIFSLDVEGSYWLYTKTEMSSFSYFQIGGGFRFWPMQKALRQLYLGAGCSASLWKFSSEGFLFFPGISVSDTVPTIYTKVGYAIPVHDIVQIDLGARVDGIDLFESTAITFYAQVNCVF